MRNCRFFIFLLANCAACRISVPQTGIEPRAPEVKAQSLNYWTSREFQIPVVCPLKSAQSLKEFASYSCCYHPAHTEHDPDL